MSDRDVLSPDAIRTRFSRAMSEMYRQEVPQYGALMALVAETNRAVLRADPDLAARLGRVDALDRIDLERHGAIRLGTAGELATMRRLFAVMGMVPVGYYDLSASGVPVHSTAFRPVDDAALARNPFRVFTSLLRLDLVPDAALREQARAILARRRIFTAGALALIDRAERAGGLAAADADAFVQEALHTFRWHGETAVDAGTYRRMRAVHPLVADVVCFKGPHINHLTPRTLDIDAVQAGMPGRGMAAKPLVEGPPPRRCPILLRQTSFKALEEPVTFAGDAAPGTHTARFGEVEQRGLALTVRGRALYDRLLAGARAEGEGEGYAARLAAAFRAFPDDEAELRRQGLGVFRYALTAAGRAAAGRAATPAHATLDDLVASGHVEAQPVVYEDFLPVSAAGIFRSNLGDAGPQGPRAAPDRPGFEAALGAPVADGMALHLAAERRSCDSVLALIRGHAA